MACILYGDLNDAELEAEIKDLREKVKTVVGGGVAYRVGGESRLVEYSQANLAGLKDLLTMAVREKRRREGEQITGAIPVYFLYGG